MPNRILKESIRTSKKVNSLNDFSFRLWAYLITYVDDYGRGSADPEILKGVVFTRRKGVTEKQIEVGLTDLATAGMIDLYEVDGESYLQFPNWGEHQRIRNSTAKFPAPVEAKNKVLPQLAATRRNSPQLAADRGLNPIQSNPESESESRIQTRARAHAGDDLSRFSQNVRAKVEAWIAYKEERGEWYRPSGLKSLLAVIEEHAREDEAAAIASIENSMSNGYKGIIWQKPAQKPEKKAASFEASELDRLINNF